MRAVLAKMRRRAGAQILDRETRGVGGSEIFKSPSNSAAFVIGKNIPLEAHAEPILALTVSRLAERRQVVKRARA